jgi:dienelactone hydrolase
MKGVGRTLIAIFVATLVVAALSSYWTAAALIARAAGTGGWIGTLARLDARAVSESIERIPIPDGAMRVRVFRPAGPANRAALLVSGVHPDGIEDRRLVGLARDLAATGTFVFTPEIEDLIEYRVTARATDAIEDAALWILGQPERFGAHAIGLIGVSFSGGLSVVAAGRPSLRDRVAYVLSFGGHGNLPRVLRYLCTGIEPAAPGSAARRRPPHDYALAIVLHQAAELAVPADQLGPLREAVETFLTASTLMRTSPEQAVHHFEDARAREAALPEPSRTLLKHVNDRDVGALGARLLPYLDRLGQDPSLSPDRSTPPSAPVYLLHGADDNVIPAVESALLAEHLRGRTRVRQLLSGYLTHVDVAARPTMRDTWEMIAFWRAVLSEY